MTVICGGSSMSDRLYRRRRPSRPSLAGGLALGAALAATPVSAQNVVTTVPAESTRPAEGDIIVTAERRSTNLQKTALAISVVPAAKLDRANIRDISDLNGFAPGLTVTKTGGRETTPAIRGIGASTPENTGSTAPGVSLFVDGVYVGDSISLGQDLFDLDHLEVLRGPQGTLYGVSSIGGALILISNQPTTDSVHAYGDAGLGNYDYRRFRASLNVPLSDTIAVRVSGQKLNHEGYARNTEDPRYRPDNADEANAKAAISWNPAPNFTATLTGQYSDRHNHGPEQKWLEDPNADARVVTQDYRGKDDYKGELVHLNLKWDLEPFSISSVSAFRHYKSTFAENVTFTTFDLFQPYENVPVWNHNERVFTQELDLLSPAGSKLVWTSGIFLMHRRATDYILEYQGNDQSAPQPTYVDPTLPVGSIPTNLSYGNQTTDIRTAIEPFVQLTYPIMDNLRLTAGARYNHEEHKHSSHNFSHFGNAAIFRKTDKTKLATWRAELAYDATPTNLLYLSGSTGYKAGGVNGNESAALVGQTFKAERNTAIEVGSKNYFADRKLRLNLAGFYYFYKNMQYIETDPIPFNQGMSNIPLVHIWGAEAELGYNGMENHLHVNGNLTYQKGRVIGRTRVLYPSLVNNVYATAPSCAGFLRFYNPACFVSVIAAAQDISGNSPPNMPKISGSVDVSYDFDVFGGTLTPFAQYLREGHRQGRIFNEPVLDDVPGYNLVNLSLSYAPSGGRLRFNLSLSNVFDKDGVNSRYTSPYESGLTSEQYVAPRQFVGSIAYSF